MNTFENNTTRFAVYDTVEGKYVKVENLWDFWRYLISDKYQVYCNESFEYVKRWKVWNEYHDQMSERRFHMVSNEELENCDF